MRILYFQARLQSSIYILISLARFSSRSDIDYYLVANRGMGVGDGCIAGTLIHVGLFGTALFIWTLSKMGLRMDFPCSGRC
jgi:hypothetical protein